MELLQRAKQLQAQGRDIIHMEVGEPDFPTPPAIIDAGIEYLRTGQVKYSPAAGLPALRELISGHYRLRYNVDIAPERILITPGASGALLIALALGLNTGEELLMTDPGYPCNENFVNFLQAKTRLIPVGADCNYQLTAELIEQNWQQQTRAVLIASPSNPTGTIIAPEQLKCCIDSVINRGGIFYSDEIYHGLDYGE
jgi:aspartate/methionine/tyrosine aminotransferase